MTPYDGASSTTRTSAHIRVSVVRPRQRCISAELRRISRRSRLHAAGRAKARWIHRFASTTSMRNNCCRFWFEKQPEVRSPEGNPGRRVRSRRHRSDRDTGLCAPTPPQFPLRPYRNLLFTSQRDEAGTRSRRKTRVYRSRRQISTKLSGKRLSGTF